MDDTIQWAKDNSPFIWLNDGESIEVIFEDRTIVPSTRDPKKTLIRYKLSGKFFDSASKTLGKDLGALVAGTKIKMTRKGTGNKTTYLVEKL